MPSAPDWRSASAYAHAYEIHLREFAWEFLRRNPDYQRDYRTAVRRMESSPSRNISRPMGIALSLSIRSCGQTTPRWFGCRSLIPPPFSSSRRTEPFSGSRSLRSLTPIFRRQASDGEHSVHHRLLAVDSLSCSWAALIATRLSRPVSRLTRILPLALMPALRLWRIADGRAVRRAADPLTRLQRRADSCWPSARSTRIWPAKRIARLPKSCSAPLVSRPARPGKHMTCVAGQFDWYGLGLKLMRGGYLELLALTPPPTPISSDREGCRNRATPVFVIPLRRLRPPLWPSTGRR